MSDPLFTALEHAVARRYTLERPLGANDTGPLFLARDLRLERPVIVAILAPDVARRADARDRFLTQARLAAGLAHPNIVPIHEVDADGELAWYVTSYIHGRSLGDLLAHEGRRPPSEVGRLAREIAWALAYAHERGIAHHHLSLRTVRLEDGTARWLLHDVGIVEGLTLPASAADPREDLRMLARVAAAALHGAAPADDEEAQLRLSDAPGWTVLPLRQCLAPGPAERPGSAQVLAEAMTPPAQAEVPTPLREWSDAKNPLGVIITTYTVVWGFVVVISYKLRGFQLPGDLILVFWPWILAWPVKIGQLRRLMKAGYGLPDIQGLLDAQLRVRREEMADRGAAQDVRPGKFLGIVGGLSFAATAYLMSTGGRWSSPLFLGTAMGGAILLAAAYRFRRTIWRMPRQRDEVLEFRGMFWRGPLGRWNAWLASRFLPRQSVVPSAFDQRPTTVILADSIRDLVAALPPAIARDFPGVRATADRLERAAVALARRVRELESLSAQGTAVAEATQQALASARARHSDAVSALETLRLALLAAHGGVANIGAATSELQAAVELADRIEQVAAAKDEVSALEGA